MARLTQLQRLNSKWAFFISDANQEKLDLMKGCEVYSLIYANCVYIDNKGRVLDNFDVCLGEDGNVVDTLNTNDKISALWEEYFFDEMGYTIHEYDREITL